MRRIPPQLICFIWRHVALAQGLPVSLTAPCLFAGICTDLCLKQRHMLAQGSMGPGESLVHLPPCWDLCWVPCHSVLHTEAWVCAGPGIEAWTSLDSSSYTLLCPPLLGSALTCASAQSTGWHGTQHRSQCGVMGLCGSEHGGTRHWEFSGFWVFMLWTVRAFRAYRDVLL